MSKAPREWKPVPGFEKTHKVSSDGQVWSLIYERPLSPAKNPQTGRLEVKVQFNKERVKWPIHRLVLWAFRGPPGVDQVACHNDGNCLNNNLENLRWDTRKANSADMMRHGTHVSFPGEKNPKAKLTQKQVDEIRESLNQNYSKTTIANHYGVSRQAIDDIQKGKRWKTVQAAKS